MKSTVIFKGSNEELYLYDTINKYLLNCHPIIEQISNIKSDEYETIKNIIFDANPEIIGSESEFEFYYKKYLFLKNNGFFSIINPKDLLSGAVTYEVVEHTLSDLGNVVFQVTNDCNMRCKYCCFGEFYNGVQEEINNMDFDTVKHLFDYLVPFGKSYAN
ncbi:hypothetical protein FACS189415_7890 [Bacteroidia bacterium]|nr:hypothetical protein FACS189415_7890 [Bacteroidia bacterium]